MSTHNLCFEQKYENYQNFSSENLSFFGSKIFSIYLNRLVFVMLLYIQKLSYNEGSYKEASAYHVYI